MFTLLSNMVCSVALHVLVGMEYTCCTVQPLPHMSVHTITPPISHTQSSYSVSCFNTPHLMYIGGSACFEIVLCD